MRDKEGYWYKNDTLIERLEISRSEQKHMKTIIDTDEKYDRKNVKRRNSRRNEEGLTKKQAELMKLKEQVDKLKNDGMSLRQIAVEVEISLAKVQRLLKK